MPRQHRYPPEQREKRIFKRSKSYDPVPPRIKNRYKKNKTKRYNTNLKNVLFVENMYSQRVFKYYKLNRKNKFHITREEWKKIIMPFLKVMQKDIVENEAGVFIDNFGYFFIMRHTNRISKRVKFNKIHGEGRRYTPSFAPIRKDNILNTWTMDFGFSSILTNKVNNKIDQGEKYKMAYSLLASLYGRKKDLILVEKKNDTNKHNSGSTNGISSI
jgi:nucleoid DNA-binding protein